MAKRPTAHHSRVIYRGPSLLDGKPIVVVAVWSARNRKTGTMLVESDADIDQAREAYQGVFASESDWAASFLDNTGTLEQIPENLRNYFDYEAYTRDARLSGDVTFVRHDGEVWVFWNH